MRQCVVVDIPESTLSDIHHHTPSRLPDGRLKRNKIKKPPLAVKKPGYLPEQKQLLAEVSIPTTSPSQALPRGRNTPSCAFLKKLNGFYLNPTISRLLFSTIDQPQASPEETSSSSQLPG